MILRIKSRIANLLRNLSQELQVFRKFKNSAALDKCCISDRDAVHLLTACLEALHINPNEYVINRTSLKRTRESFRKSTAENIKRQFTNSEKVSVVIHWDSKMLPAIG